MALHRGFISWELKFQSPFDYEENPFFSVYKLNKSIDKLIYLS